MEKHYNNWKKKKTINILFFIKSDIFIIDLFWELFVSP